MITGNPLDTLPFNSQDFKRISTKLDSQICVKASVSREEKVCCDDDQEVSIRYGYVQTVTSVSGFIILTNFIFG